MYVVALAAAVVTRLKPLPAVSDRSISKPVSLVDASVQSTRRAVAERVVARGLVGAFRPPEVVADACVVYDDALPAFLDLMR